MGVTMPFPRSDNWYYHTDREGWSKLVSHLLFKSNLYKAERFECEDYAIKAMITAAELFGLNTFRYTYGQMPLGRHGFNSFWTGMISYCLNQMRDSRVIWILRFSNGVKMDINLLTYCYKVSWYINHPF